MTSWDDFKQLARTRRATRKFRSDPIPNGLLTELIDTARWAPSGYNLQPTHFFAVTDERLRVGLCRACLDQRQIIEAPATVVFAADRDVAKNNLDMIIRGDLDVGGIDEEFEQILRKYVSLGFDHGPMGLGWFAKAVAAPVMGQFRPVPIIPGVHKRYWLAKQVMLSSMVFMLAATSAGLATCPMEGFDERRVQRVLGIPRRFVVCVVVPVGYADARGLKKSRLPLEKVMHVNKW